MVFTKRQIIALVVIFIVLLIGALFGFFTTKPRVTNENREINPPPSVTKEGESAPAYTPEVPKNAVQTIPKAEAPASSNPELNTKLKFFDLKVSNSGFNPNTITVKKGDSLQVDFTAVDGDYDLDFPYLGAYFSVVRRGVTKRLPLDTSLAGTFTFGCRDFCPDSGKIQGRLIVLP